MAAIHQFLAGFNPVDAISNEALMMRAIFRKWGHTAHIYTEERCLFTGEQADIRDIKTIIHALAAEDVVLLHLSMGSVVNEVFAGLTCQRTLLYHNITPPEFFTACNTETARFLARGRDQLALLAGKAAVTMADSAFNARDLQLHGFDDVKVLPLILDLGKLEQVPDMGALEPYRDDAVNVIFIGRCVPNKRIDDALNAFYYFQRYVQPRSRFIHIGSFDLSDRYCAFLQAYVRQTGLKNVVFPGAVSQVVMNAWFHTADLFLCMSDHEGFCIPIIESMVMDVPVLAYAVGAVPGTMDGAGVLVHDKDFALIAEMMGCLTGGAPTLREAVLRGQRARMERYRALDLENMLRTYLAPVLRS